MKKYYVLVTAFIYLGIGNVSAQFMNLHNFNDTNGMDPLGSLIISGNTLYGMATDGGAHGAGSVFSEDTNGNNYTDLHDFTGIAGEYPYGDLLLYNSKLYGMTNQGGAMNYGCIFSMSTDGSNYKDIFNFDGNAHGKNPYGSLIVVNNLLYGTIFGGIYGMGGIFSIDTNGNGYRLVYGFSGTNGSTHSTLLNSGNKLFGMTFNGGVGSYGSIFSVDTNGADYKELFDFNVIDGESPFSSLIISGSQLFGMTYMGGANGDGNVFSIDTNGTNFKDILDFNNVNGKNPNGSIIISGDKLYGMTSGGGSGSPQFGCVFSVDTNGHSYKQLFGFNGNNGGSPNGSLILSGKALFGMASYGGLYNDGIVFKLDSSAVTSVNNITATGGSLNVYPNPSHGGFTVSIRNYESGTRNQIEVYNSVGEKVFSQMSIPIGCGMNYQVTVNLNNQAGGVYLYRVLNEDGSLLGEGKIVIQK